MPLILPCLTWLQPQKVPDHDGDEVTVRRRCAAVLFMQT